ncbi:probable G-protein coupled receptor Mth-like 6 [Drosophila kikkawai]|uniref:Probable G-protein coupled receptor Mth-like 6 n=1 Tax=Drosophila kikkawai TaxID=30033 RepID=A0A6P4IGJ0_DROKI|nr:probable G-protein coupled receptor Mth-like 7 [Drosophila kikkawai]
MFHDTIKLYSIIFVAFLELIFLQTAKADIPGCHFLETVNITSSLRLQNGSYMYQDIEIPEYLTGQYDYITTELDYNETVKSHLRGCVCQLKPCIWICCRFKDWDEPNSKCTDGLMEELAKINPFLNVTLINGSVVETNLLKNFIVLRDRLRYFDFWEIDKYTIFEDGSILLNITPTVIFRGYDCLHPNQFISGNTESFMAAVHHRLYNAMPLFKNAVNKKRYVMIYFSIAKFSWLLALSHQLWRGFTSVNRVESEYSFGTYSIFAWGSAAILTGVPFLIDQIWDSDPNSMQWVSGIVADNYFHYIIETPLEILVALNTILFMLTIISIIRVKLSLRHFSDQDERARNLNSRMQT